METMSAAAKVTPITESRKPRRRFRDTAEPPPTGPQPRVFHRAIGRRNPCFAADCEYVLFHTETRARLAELVTVTARYRDRVTKLLDAPGITAESVLEE